MYEVSIKTRFSGAHHLRGYPGKCAEPHGHNWDVEVFVQGEALNETGICVDFRKLKDELAGVLESLDHSDLNAHPAFAGRNPTSENIAAFLYKEFSKKCNSADRRVARVFVRETPETGASYWE